MILPMPVWSSNHGIDSLYDILGVPQNQDSITQRDLTLLGICDENGKPYAAKTQNIFCMVVCRGTLYVSVGDGREQKVTAGLMCTLPRTKISKLSASEDCVVCPLALVTRAYFEKALSGKTEGKDWQMYDVLAGHYMCKFTESNQIALLPIENNDGVKCYEEQWITWLQDMKSRNLCLRTCVIAHGGYAPSSNIHWGALSQLKEKVRVLNITAVIFVLSHYRSTSSVDINPPYMQ